MGENLNQPESKLFKAVDLEKNFSEQIFSNLNDLVIQNSKGSLKTMGLYHLSSPGKFLRSKIISKLGSIYELSSLEILNWSLTCELLHEASLIHDDLQDGDINRRNQTSVWQKFGSAQAINLGDFFLMLSFLPLGHLHQSLTTLHSKTALKLVEGQANESDLNDLIQSKESFQTHYVECAHHKTGALFASLAQGVGLIAGVKHSELKFLTDIFSNLGLIFQIQDDILDLFGNKKRGLQGSDIQEGKCSALIAIHLDNNIKDLEPIKSILSKSRQETTNEDIDCIRKLILEKNTLSKTLDLMQDEIKNIKISFDQNTELYNPLLQEEVSKFILQILKPIESIINQSAT